MGKFSDFAKDTKKLEAKMTASASSGERDSVVPAKEKNPDDLEIK